MRVPTFCNQQREANCSTTREKLTQGVGACNKKNQNNCSRTNREKGHNHEGLQSIWRESLDEKRILNQIKKREKPRRYSIGNLKICRPEKAWNAENVGNGQTAKTAGSAKQLFRTIVRVSGEIVSEVGEQAFVGLRYVFREDPGFRDDGEEI